MLSTGKQQSVSIVFRALNEEKWFAQALEACRAQTLNDLNLEIILVDSGSTDRTVDIAESFGCRITHIKKADFTFGRSLNQGCDAATGDLLVFISAHCIPADKSWLGNLIAPLISGEAQYTYGRQIGHEVTRFSEHQVFGQYYPGHGKEPKGDFFVNNANSAISKSLWAKYKFDESVTGLEDMVLGKAIVADGGRVVYVPEAAVEHIHEETLQQVKHRYYREALTLREIMPEVHFHFSDFIRYFVAGVFNDFSKALDARVFFSETGSILAYRLMQYWGSYRGHNEHRKLSREQKERYYYPKSYGSTLSAKSQQPKDFSVSNTVTKS